MNGRISIVANALKARNAIGKRAIEASNAFDENAYKKTVISKVDKAIDDIEHRRKDVVHIGASKIRFPYAEQKKINEKANKHHAQVYFDDDGEISVYRLKAWMYSAYD